MRKAYFITFVSCLLAQSALSQSNNISRQLIFDPILIQAEQTLILESDNESSKEGGDDKNFEISYIEINSLPNLPPQLSSKPLPEKDSNTSDLQLDLATSAVSFALSINQYEQAIRALELEGGPYEARLSQELLSLGNVYQQQGDQQQALGIYDKALHVNRINNGLYSLSQKPIIEAIIDSYFSLGDLVTANDQQEYLFYLQKKAYKQSSPEFIPILEAFADWNILAFSLPLGVTTAHGPDTPAFNIATNTLDKPEIFQSFLIKRLVNAQKAYRSISQILLNNYGVEEPRLLKAEQQMALINYFFFIYFETKYETQFYDYDTAMASTSSMGYRNGRDAFQRRIQYLQEMEDTSPEDLAMAMVELGDWYVISRKRTAAAGQYEEARKILLASEASESRINEILDTPYLSPIPNFLALKNTRKANKIPKDIALNYRGYIDLEITINRYGIPTTITLLGKTVNTTPAIESRLAALLNRAQFRPRVVNDKLLSRDQFTLRYYYSY